MMRTILNISAALVFAIGAFMTTSVTTSQPAERGIGRQFPGQSVKQQTEEGAPPCSCRTVLELKVPEL